MTTKIILTILMSSVMGNQLQAAEPPHVAHDIAGTKAETNESNVVDQVLAKLQAAQNTTDFRKIINQYYDRTNANKFLINDSKRYMAELKRIIDNDPREGLAVFDDLREMLDIDFLVFHEGRSYFMRTIVLPLANDRFKAGIQKSPDFKTAFDSTSYIFGLDTDDKFVNEVLNIHGHYLIPRLRKLLSKENLTFPGYFNSNNNADVLLNKIYRGLYEEYSGYPIEKETKVRLKEFAEAIIDPDKTFQTEADIIAINRAQDLLLTEGKVSEYLKIISKKLNGPSVSQNPQASYDLILESFKHIVRMNAPIKLEDARNAEKIVSNLLKAQALLPDQAQELNHLVFINFYLRIQGLPLEEKLVESIDLLFSLGDLGKSHLQHLLKFKDLIENPNKKRSPMDHSDYSPH